MKQLKRGPASNDERAYVEAHFRTKSHEEMASELNRSPRFVANLVLEQGGEVPHGSLLTALRTRPEWETFRLEFTDDELKVFEHYYIKLMGQFGGEEAMLPTEEMQVFALIRCMLNITRTQREKRKHREDMELIERRLDELKLEAKPRGAGRPRKDDETIKLVHERKALEDRYSEIARGLKDLDARLNVQEARQSQLTQDLKGTRNQRVKMIEDAKQSYTGLIRLLMEEDFRLKQEEQMRMAAVAAAKEKRRLSAPHKYADGVVDQPLLTHETLLKDYDAV